MTENTNETVVVELSANVEVNDGATFNLYAAALGVKVGERGRKPKAELVKAIQASDKFTLVDTEYLNASMATGDSGGATEYGKAKAAARAERNAAIKAVNDAYAARVAELKAEFEVTTPAPVTVVKPAGDVIVRAYTPQITKDGQVKRAPKSGKVQFRPNVREVTLTSAEIRALAPDAPVKGRQSGSQTLYAAVLAGGWFSEELMTPGWEAELLKPVPGQQLIQPVPVESPEPVESVAAAE